MKRYTIWTVCIGWLLLLAACQKEEELTPSDMQSNWFAPDASAMDEESVLRRTFYDETGCFLLFSDTLRKEYQGTDGNGNPYYRVETLAPEWNMTSTSKDRLDFEYLETMEQKQAVYDFLKNYLVRYIAGLNPFAVLAVNNMDLYTADYGFYEYSSSPMLYTNTRCFIFNVSSLWAAVTEDEKADIAKDICCEMVVATWNVNWKNPYIYNGSALTNDFFYYNNLNYDYRKSYAGIPPGLGDEYLSMLNEIGFLVNTHETKCPTAKEDAVSYIKAILGMTEVEFKEKYGKYSIIMKKYNTLKPLLGNTGIKF